MPSMDTLGHGWEGSRIFKVFSIRIQMGTFGHANGHVWTRIWTWRGKCKSCSFIKLMGHLCKQQNFLLKGKKHIKKQRFFFLSAIQAESDQREDDKGGGGGGGGEDLPAASGRTYQQHPVPSARDLIAQLSNIEKCLSSAMYAHCEILSFTRSSSERLLGQWATLKKIYCINIMCIYFSPEEMYLEMNISNLINKLQIVFSYIFLHIK